MSDFMSQSYHDVMEAYKRPPSIRFIPRIFGWLTVFILLFGVSKTAYAYDAEPVIWVQVPQWTDCLLYTSPSPRDDELSRMPSSA